VALLVSADSRPLILASASVSSAKAASWVVKALVEATPISGPARVMKRSAVSRTMADSGTLQMASVRCMPRPWRA
jgi:hypothetical protein